MHPMRLPGLYVWVLCACARAPQVMSRSFNGVQDPYFLKLSKAMADVFVCLGAANTIDYLGEVVPCLRLCVVVVPWQGRAAAGCSWEYVCMLQVA